MCSLQANYDFKFSVIHQPYLKTTSKIIPHNQHKFRILNQNKEARCQLGGDYAYEQQSKSVPSCFDSSKYDAHIEYYKKFTVYDEFKHGQEKAWKGRNINVQQHQESAKQLFPRECGISRYNGAMKYKYNNFSHVCWSCKHQLVLLSDSPRTMEDWDGDMLKIVSHGKLLEREVMVHEKCYREYTRLPKDETVSCLKLHIKNVNTKY